MYGLRSGLSTFRSGLFVLIVLLISSLGAVASDNIVISHQKINDSNGGLDSVLSNVDNFGCSLAWLGDLDGDGVSDLAVGANEDDELTYNTGAVYILFLNSLGTVTSQQKISDTQGNFNGALDYLDRFGTSVANLGDVDNDGVVDLAVGAIQDDDGGTNRGAVYILFMNTDGTVKSHQKISDTEGGFSGILDDEDFFGEAVAGLGDLNGDGVEDLAVGTSKDDDGGSDRGAVWILFLNSDGTVDSHQKISSSEGGFTGPPNSLAWFGRGIAVLDDLDGDGVKDLAVGAPLDSSSCVRCGAVWILFLDYNGTVKSQTRISHGQSGFTGDLTSDDYFGYSVCNAGDLNQDGVADLAVGAIGDDDGQIPGEGGDLGAVWILFMDSLGTVTAHEKISQTQGGFNGDLDPYDYFGASVASLGLLNADGWIDIAVGAPNDNENGDRRGAVWVLFLHEPPVPVALQEYQASWTGRHVEVLWRLTGVEGEVAFEIMRLAGENGRFVTISNAGVERRQDAFVFEDHTTEPGKAYVYQVTVREDGDIVTRFETQIFTPPMGFTLDQNYPNPFNPSTHINFTLDAKEPVTLGVYDISGSLVSTLISGCVMPAGMHSQEWNGLDDSGAAAASGVYFIRLQAGEKVLTRKAVLLK